MIRSLVGLTLLFLAGLAIYLFFYLGFNQPVEVSVETRGSMHLLYADHHGAYHQIGPVIQMVEQWTFEHNVACPRTFGEYLDDPAAIDQDRLRSRGGCLLNAPLSTPLPETLKYELRPEASYIVGRFHGSPSIGPFKIYPKIEEYVNQQRLKASRVAIEVYTVNGDQVMTEVLFQIEN